MLFSELCTFEEAHSIHGKFKQFVNTDTPEECATKVRNEQPNATGVRWNSKGLDARLGCQAAFGNALNVDPDEEWWSCLLHGKKYSSFFGN